MQCLITSLWGETSHIGNEVFFVTREGKSMSLAQKWEEYHKTKSRNIRNEIVKEYLAFVNYLVGRIIQIPPGMNREDLVQYGFYGLIEAVERYDPMQGAKFETYAAKRINGAIMDQIRNYGRANGGLSRSNVKKLKMVEASVRKLEQKHKRNPTHQEIAEDLQITIDEYYKLLADINQMAPVSLDDFVGSDQNISVGEVVKIDKNDTPEDIFMASERSQMLAKAIDELEEKEKIIFILYYYEKMTLGEIGDYLNLSESRISQLHKASLILLKNKLSGGN